MEPLAHPLVLITKKYLIALSKQLRHLSIERYQYVLLLIDDHAELLTQKALAELLQIDKSYMVTILNYLEEREYVVREKNTHDRRQQLIRLTEKARTEIPEIRKAIVELNKMSFKNLTETQIEIFNEVLHNIQNNLSDSKPSEMILEYKKTAF